MEEGQLPTPAISLGKFHHDLTATSLEIMVSKGNHPQMALRFRLVNYYNLPRYIIIYIYIYRYIQYRVYE